MANIWNRILGRFKRTDADPSAEAPSERAAAVLTEMRERARPCLRLVPGEGGNSRLGGTPEMSGPWPRYDGRPLSLIAQLDLVEMHTAGGPDWLPREGRLLFFYELEHGGWGFDPKDAGSALVRHETGAAEHATEPTDLPPDKRFDANPVGFASAVSLPSEERLERRAFNRTHILWP